MATVSGVLSDIADIELEYEPEITFRLNGPATNAESFQAPGGATRASGGALYATKAVRPSVSSTGFFTIDLHPTDDMVAFNGRASYRVGLSWLDPVGRRVERDIISDLHVPAEGGLIGGLIQATLPGWFMWAGTSLPDAYNVPGNFWWDTASDDIWKVV